MTHENPLLNTKYAVPPLDQLRAEHFKPALDIFIAKAQRDFQALKDDASATDFETLAVPLQAIFHDMQNLRLVFKHLADNASTPEIEALEDTIIGAYDGLEKSVYQDSDIAQRFKALYDQGFAGYSEDDQQLMRHQHEQFASAGAFLDDAARTRIRAIDQDLIRLSTQFMRNLKGAERQLAVYVTDETDLAGIDAATIDDFRIKAQSAGHETGWLIEIDRLQIDALLVVADNRDLRQKLLHAVDALGTQEPYDNQPLLESFLNLRQERAQMMGDDHYAAFALKTTMVGTLARVEKSIADMAHLTLPHFEKDMQVLEEFSAAHGGPTPLEPWDVSYWAAKYQAAHAPSTADETPESLPLEGVIADFISHAERLFDVTFYKNDMHPRVHPDVAVYDVIDNESHEEAGVLYIDAYMRPGKKGSAWMEQMQYRIGGKSNCITMNVNHPKSTSGQPTMISFDDALTVFHEGGHGLHGLLGTTSRYPILHGPGLLSPDFTETFSNIQELWLSARKPATGSFFQAWDKLRLLQNSLYDLGFHKADPATYKGHDDLQKSVAFDTKYAAHLRPYPLPRFFHLFGEALSKYAAGYNGYYISQMNAAHGFAPFKRNGLYSPAHARDLKAMYKDGGARDMNTCYERLAGPATPDAFVANMGLAVETAPPTPPAPRCTHS